MDFFDKIFCINLDSRPDRWEKSKIEFDKHGIKVDRISAIDGKKLNISPNPEGVKACALSHLHVLKLAKYLGLDNYLILEDDIEFHENFVNLFNEIKEQIPNNWDLLYLGANHYWGQNLQKISDHIYKCEYSVAAHAVGIKHTVYDLFIEKLNDLSKPCDMHFAEAQAYINAYVIVPHLAWQKEGYSDIQYQNMNYWFLKDHAYPNPII